jgi:hypothetical protein
MFFLLSLLLYFFAGFVGALFAAKASGYCFSLKGFVAILTDSGNFKLTIPHIVADQ